MYPSQESLQGCYQADMLAGVTRWNCIAYNWKRIPRLVQRALREALSGEKGAVHMDVPVDVFFEAHFVSERKLRELIPPPGTSRFQGLVLPDEGESHRAASLIEGSRKPVIAAGSGVLREEVWDALALLAESLPAPVVLTPPALSAATGDDPRYAGIAGHPALGVVEEILQEADLVLMIGVTLDEGEKILSTVDAARTKIIQTSPQPELLGALGPVDAALAGDAASLARVLAAGVKGGGESRREWTRNRRRSFEASRDALRGDAGRRGPGAAVRALGEALLPDDLLVMDGKESIYWGSVLCPAGKNNTRFISYGLRGFGYGLPTALGVKLARPRERVLALCDTDALFHHIQELETARREEIAVTVCVVGEPYDWVEVAEGFGLAGARADTPAELMNALQAADTRGRTTVIDLTRFGE
jgi:acetolactate synthase-1/2/3 large subunit